MARVTESPRPVPSPSGFVLKKGSRMRSRMPSGIPGPASNANRDPAAVGSHVGGVQDEVQERLADLPRISGDGDALGFGVARRPEIDAASAEDGPDEPPHVVREISRGETRTGSSGRGRPNSRRRRTTSRKRRGPARQLACVRSSALPERSRSPRTFPARNTSPHRRRAVVPFAKQRRALPDGAPRLIPGSF